MTIESKTCSQCGDVKPTSEFYSDKRARDGLRSHCKACHIKAVHAYKEADPVRRKDQDDKWRKRNPDRVRAARDRYRHTHPWYKAEHNREWRRKHPERTKAHDAVNKAKQRGKIAVASMCQCCEAEDVSLEGHHPDYSKPLNVVWLCRKCHACLGRHEDPTHD